MRVKHFVEIHRVFHRYQLHVRKLHLHLKIAKSEAKEDNNDCMYTKNYVHTYVLR